MDNYIITRDQFKNINPHRISTILLKDGTTLIVNNNDINNDIQYEYENDDNLFNNNSNNKFNNCYSDDNNGSNKIKKYNSFSAKVKMKDQENHLKGRFYIKPIPYAHKRIITLKSPENFVSPNKYHVENFTFRSSPKRYNYKPYKQPKRKYVSKPTSHIKKNSCTCCCKCSSCKK